MCPGALPSATSSQSSMVSYAKETPRATGTCVARSQRGPFSPAHTARVPRAAFLSSLFLLGKLLCLFAGQFSRIEVRLGRSARDPSLRLKKGYAQDDAVEKNTSGSAHGYEACESAVAKLRYPISIKFSENVFCC